MNVLFQNALNNKIQNIPPIWFMRQAGRYHKHYQNLRSKYSFEQLCKQPEVAADVALGPISDFDFDVSILFSDILFPLDGLGMQLSYTDSGPKFQQALKNGFKISSENTDLLIDKALNSLTFQAEALKCTRAVLPSNKSLIGFIGGFWTLFVYACEGGHAGSMTFSKNQFLTDTVFVDTLIKVLDANIEMQIKAGAEIVMIFDTAVGEVSPAFFKAYIQPTLVKWANKYPKRLGYYSKYTQRSFFDFEFLNAPWAGLGIDHRWNLPKQLIEKNSSSKTDYFLQGNFDQAMLFQDTEIFKNSLNTYLADYKQLSLKDRAGWVCGLGHGVLPNTPEKHVHIFIETVRKMFS